jgi:hypothetical protein
MSPTSCTPAAASIEEASATAEAAAAASDDEAKQYSPRCAKSNMPFTRAAVAAHERCAYVSVSEYNDSFVECLQKMWCRFKQVEHMTCDT